MTKTRRVSWLLGGLTAMSVLFSSQLYLVYSAEGVPMPFRSLLVLQLCHWYFWALAGPIAWVLVDRWPIRAGQRQHNGLRHAASAVAIGLLIVAAYGVAYYGIVRMPMTRGWFTQIDRSRSFRVILAFCFSAYFHVELLIYAAVVSVAHAVRSNRELGAREREALQLSSQLANARLQVLTAQLQPHFLFNTLHTIGSLILQRNSDDAMRILAELGELLRMTLDRQKAGLIPLRDELDQLRRYLRIEEARFGDRMTVRWNIDPAAGDALVPPFILQPLVENALRHGVSRRVEPATLEVCASTRGCRLGVSVYNDGPQLRDGWSAESYGFGLRNVHERLLTHGDGSTLTLANVGTDGVLASVEMPLLVTADERVE